MAGNAPAGQSYATKPQLDRESAQLVQQSSAPNQWTNLTVDIAPILSEYQKAVDALDPAFAQARATQKQAQEQAARIGENYRAAGQEAAKRYGDVMGMNTQDVAGIPAYQAMREAGNSAMQEFGAFPGAMPGRAYEAAKQWGDALTNRFHNEHLGYLSNIVGIGLPFDVSYMQMQPQFAKQQYALTTALPLAQQEIYNKMGDVNYANEVANANTNLQQIILQRAANIAKQNGGGSLGASGLTGASLPQRADSGGSMGGGILSNLGFGGF